jgi:hypothetical protein
MTNRCIAILIFVSVPTFLSARMEFTRNVPVSEFPERLREQVTHHPVIHISREWQPSKTVYAMDSEPDATGSAILAHFAIMGQKPFVSAGLGAQKHIGLMRVRVGDTTVRDVQFAREYVCGKSDSVYETPALTFGTGAGGKMYQFADHMSDRGTVGPGYHKILVRENARPLRMYQVSVEHIRGGTSAHIALEEARDVCVYGLKHEGANHIVKVTNCEGIRLWGGLSNAPCPDYTPTLIEIENSPDTRVAVMASYAKSMGKARLQDGGVSLGDDALLTYYENASGR